MDSIDSMGDRIKQIRKKLTLTQKALGQKLGISAATLSEIENNRHRLGHEYIAKLARQFNVNLYYLFLGNGPLFGNDPFDLEDIDKSVLDAPDVKNFLYYFFKSAYVRYHTLAEYEKFYLDQKEWIEKYLNNSRR